jgi:rubrerythrin
MESERPDHAARPEQVQTGFGEGAEQEPRTPEEQHVGDFAEGIEAHTPEEERVGRFSEGIEETPETPEKNLEGSFAEGVEADPSDRYAEAGEQAAVREATDPDNPPG